MKRVGAGVAGRVSDRSRKARARLLVAAGCTLNALGFTMVGSAVHADFTPLALIVTAVGIFATTWFLLDAGIALTADVQRRRAARRQI